ncbi:HlyD family efflux transporter periplasmic adaptor subunit [Zongyangia hominis]|uniref:Membrane fusion protein n=1 Tax=Zongyangia hominis TaxID=2763677 RepID=A0A926E9F1_9FIRM|nr:HlyD family efflux transporter periplasmic adaptor subunit [Zongyangia hominis]MBC8569638.1 hypothetical protein [Zongyangia hominis]
MNNRTGKVLIFVFSLFLIVYAGYQAVRYFYAPCRTETAFNFTVADSVTSQGIIIRDEAVIEGQQQSGVVSYVNADGTKVSQGSVIAEIYPSEQYAADKVRIEELDYQIGVLEEAQNAGTGYYANSDSITRQIADQLGHYIDQASTGQVGEIDEAKKNLVSLINKKQVSTGSSADYTATIEQLSNEKAQLEERVAAGAEQTITSPLAGIFVGSVDGLEDSLNFEAMDKMTVKEYESFISQTVEGKSGSVGKIISEFNWFYAAQVSPDETTKFVEGSLVKLTFAGTDGEVMPGKIMKIISDDTSKNNIVIIRCNRMSSDLAQLRTAEAQIQFETYTGLRVPDKAIRIQDDVRGVFVRLGDRVIFKKIDPIYVGKGFILSAVDTLDEDGSLQLFDEIIVEGTDLYDGKLLK